MQLFVSLLFQFILGPLFMDFMKKRDEDPEFQRRSDVIFAEWTASSSTDERRKALRDLHDLIKG